MNRESVREKIKERKICRDREKQNPEHIKEKNKIKKYRKRDQEK